MCVLNNINETLVETPGSFAASALVVHEIRYRVGAWRAVGTEAAGRSASAEHIRRDGQTVRVLVHRSLPLKPRAAAVPGARLAPALPSLMRSTHSRSAAPQLRHAASHAASTADSTAAISERNARPPRGRTPASRCQAAFRPFFPRFRGLPGPSLTVRGGASSAASCEAWPRSRSLSVVSSGSRMRGSTTVRTRRGRSADPRTYRVPAWRTGFLWNAVDACTPPSSGPDRFRRCRSQDR